MMNANDHTLPGSPVVGPNRDITAVVAGALGLVFMTQGPVISWWTRPSQPWDQFAVPAAVTAVYLATHAVALWWLRGRTCWSRLPHGRAAVVAGLCGVVMLSTLWSVSPPITFTTAVGFIGTALSAVWFTARLNARQQAIAVFVGMQLGLTASSFAVLRDWSLSRDITGAWTGVYYNRNSLAPVAGMALLASAFVARGLVIATSRRPRRTVAQLGVVLVLDVQACVLLAKSGSMTTLVALVAAGATTLLLVGARRLRMPWEVVGGGALAAAVAGGVLLVKLADPLSRRAERDDGYSSRLDIWGFVADGIHAKPWGGWGFNAAWWDPVFRAPLEINGWFSAVTTAHNGYLEIVLGAGVPGAIALLAFLVISIGGVTRDQLSARPAPWQVCLVAFGLVANLQESFIVANHFVWLLLVAGVVGRPPVDDIVRSSRPGYPAGP